MPFQYYTNDMQQLLNKRRFSMYHWILNKNNGLEKGIKPIGMQKIKDSKQFKLRRLPSITTLTLVHSHHTPDINRTGLLGRDDRSRNQGVQVDWRRVEF